MIFAASIIKLGIYFESFASCPLVAKSVFGLFNPSPYRIGHKFFSDGHRLHHFERKCTLTPNPLAAFGDAAAEAGVSLALETHDDFSTGETVAALLSEAAHPTACSPRHCVISTSKMELKEGLHATR
jgi:hypothetical protein